MSNWTHIRGVVQVEVPGRTQHEKDYIVRTVLDHLPTVTGSEVDMNVLVSKAAGWNCSSTCDEFGEWSKRGAGRYGDFETQDIYYLTLDGDFRDRELSQTKAEFFKWLQRLAKRLLTRLALVKIYGYEPGHYEKTGKFDKELVFNLTNLEGLHEDYSWFTDGKTVNWCESFMWDAARNDEGRIYCGKPDFPDGTYLEDLTEEQLDKKFPKRKLKSKRKWWGER